MTDKKRTPSSRRQMLVQLGALSLLPLGLAGCDAVEGDFGPTIKFSRQFSTKALSGDLAKIGSRLGDPLILRVFKEEYELEAWVLPDGKKEYVHFRTYPICYYSGDLGPKTKYGDKQSPEGFYWAQRQHVRAQSQYHRAIDFGYPNTYDRAHGYTGSELLIHGNCVSSGCYAMTDPLIDQLYEMTKATASGSGQGFWIHAFPFRMSSRNMGLHREDRWLPFWKQLKSGYDAFELTKIPPKVTVKNRHYVVEARTSLDRA